MEELKRKLRSRKLWAAAAAFLGALLLTLFDGGDGAWRAELLQKGVAALCVYIGGESAVDIAAALKKQ